MLQRGVDFSDDKLITPQPFHLPLVPHVFVNMTISLSFSICMILRDLPVLRITLLCNRTQRQVWLGCCCCFFFAQSVAPSRAHLKWRCHPRRCWSALQLELYRHERTLNLMFRFFCTVHLSVFAANSDMIISNNALMVSDFWNIKVLKYHLPVLHEPEDWKCFFFVFVCIWISGFNDPWQCTKHFLT